MPKPVRKASGLHPDELVVYVGIDGAHERLRPDQGDARLPRARVCIQ
jgi:hypothetical protein